jgi:glycosyltransferase involved in cell wall biosynthesis
VPGIDFVGEVKDVRSYLDRAAVIVVPLRIGGGSRLKILEALAAGKAVVSTSVGAEGLDLNPGKDVLIADSPHDFARGVINLLLAKAARRELGANGRKLVTEKYGWDEIGRRLEAVWLETAGQQQACELVRAPARESYARS